MDQLWKEKIDTLYNMKKQVEEAGGIDRIQRQHASSKLTARERMEALFDDHSFVEMDDMVTSRATDFEMEKKKKIGDGAVTGYGFIHGRLAFASSQDFTVGGGALGESQAKRICRAMEKAMDMKAPFISINDSGGARIEEGIDSLSGYGDIFYRNTLASGVIPQISVIMGPCAGGACYSPAISDFIFMTEETSQMYITGPSVVQAVTGEKITARELGGAQVHSEKSGVAHFVYKDDLDCLNGVRRLLGYLPQNYQDQPMVVNTRQIDNCSRITEIVPADPQKGYDVRDVIHTFCDQNSFLEVQPDFAKNLVIGFARLEGKTIGIVANQAKHMAGALEINASDKGARFIRFCDCFNIPLLTMVDVPAFLPGKQQEHGGIIRHGAKILYAYSEATVPKVTIIMRKAYGGAYIAMNSRELGADVVYAWPIAEIAVMGAQGAIGIIGRKKIKAAEKPEQVQQELLDEYNTKFMNPYLAAKHGYVSEVIFPDETRKKLICAFRMLTDKMVQRPSKKHGNIPL